LANNLGGQFTQVTYTSAHKLAESQNADGHEILLAALRHPDNSVSAAAAYAIRNAENVALVPLLAKMTHDTSAKARCDAVQLLRYLDLKIARQEAARLQHDRIAKVRVTAKQVLEGLPDTKSWTRQVDYGGYVAAEIEAELARLDLGPEEESLRLRAAAPAPQISYAAASDTQVRSDGDDISSYRPEPRYLNSWLTDSEGDTPVPPSRALLPDHVYNLACQIGPPSPLSAVVKNQDHPFPDLTKDGSAVEVELLIAGNDFAVLDRGRVTVTVPVRGPSKAAQIQLRTPSRSGSATLRILAMYRGNCLMSQLLQADIVTGSGYTIVIDYVLTADMSQLPSLLAQDLSLHTAMENADEIRLVVGGGSQDMFSTSLNDARIRSAAGMARNALVDVHFGPQGSRSRYDDHNSCKPQQCYKDLALLATRGWMLYQNVIDDPRRRRELRDMLRRISLTSGRPARLQIATAEGRITPFPWQLVYDIPVTGHPPSFTSCPTLEGWLSGANRGIPTSCSYKHEQNTLCPFGFWGYAYELASPASGHGQDLPIFVKSRDGALRAIAAVSERLNATATQNHFQQLGLDVKQLRTVHDLENQIYNDHPDVVYFYCHGKREDIPGGYPRPLLEIGRDELIAPEDIAAWSEKWPDCAWRDPRPLIFMNGCHTSELTPDLLTDFVTTFGDVNAAGSIGTEVALTQLVASEAAELIFAAFNGPYNVAAAMRLMRWNLLRKGNVMGLNYTPYC